MRKISYWFLLCSLLVAGTVQSQEKFDRPTVEKIRTEEMERSKVMDIAFNLTDVSGSRLTISPGFTRAANYAVKKLKEWGLTNVALEPWGEFGKGWEIQKSYVAMTAPYYKSMIAVPKAWTKGTNGVQTPQVMVVTLKDSTDLEKYKGKLKGKVLIMDRTDVYTHSFKADANRYTDEELEKMANEKPRERGTPDTTGGARRREQMTALRAASAAATALKTLAAQEGAVAILSATSRGHDGTLFVQGGGGF